MTLAATNTYGNAQIVPLYPNEARAINVNIFPSLTLAQGTVLGEITSGNDDTYTISTGAQTTGTFTVTVNGATTPAQAYGVSAATLQSAIRALSTVGGANATVTLAGTPGTNGVYTVTFVGLLSSVATTLTADYSLLTTPANAATVHTNVTVGRGVYKAYASGNTDGSQIPKGVLEYPCATDSSGLITIGSASGVGQFGGTQKAAPIFIHGSFLTAELVGFDANAVSALGGKLDQGTYIQGIYSF